MAHARRRPRTRGATVSPAGLHRPFALLAVAAALGPAACGGPVWMLPGGALDGTVATRVPEDWSFLTDPFVDLETRPSDPYSVEINYFVRGGRLYIDPAEGRRWLAFIREDPRVRARFDGVVYPLVAVRVEDPAELEGFARDRFVYRLDPRPDGR